LNWKIRTETGSSSEDDCEGVSMNTIIQTKDLTIRFGSLVANDRLNIEIEAGTIHAIAGENGAGKSTLMKMLYGVYKPTSGQILIDGEVMHGWNAAMAREKGIGMVFQDFRLIPAFTVLENVFLSLKGSGFVLRKKELRRQIRQLSEEYHLGVDPDEEVWKLDLGQRQHIEIIKVLSTPNIRVMIFDEPTSVLAPHEISRFLEMLKSFREKGYAILFITHKIDEIVSVADRITVLRHGRITASLSREEGFDREQIIHRMLEDDISRMQIDMKRTTPDIQDDRNVILEHLTIRDEHNREILKDINLGIKRGRILGVAGISGNGQREFAECLFGVRKSAFGRVLFGKEDITGYSTGKRIERGFRMVTEDPIHDNVVGNFTVLENMALAGLTIKTRHADIDWDDLERQFGSHKEIADLNVPEIHRTAGTLSGGNVQRMTFARAVVSNPSLLIACYPSRGLDVATVAVVHQTLLRLRNQGTAIVLISEDLSELIELSDELAVFAGGSVAGPFDPGKTDINELGRVMLRGAGTDE